MLYFNVDLNDIDHILSFGLERSCETFSYPINSNLFVSLDSIANKEFLTTEECEVSELERCVAPLYCHPRIVKAQIDTKSEIENDFDNNVKTRQLKQSQERNPRLLFFI